MPNTDRVAELIKKQLEGKLTTNEKLQLQRWVEQDPANKFFLDKVLQKDILWEDVLIWLELERSDQDEWQRRLEEKVFTKISITSNYRKPNEIVRMLVPYAAAILLFAVIGSVYYYVDKRQTDLEDNQIAQDIAPGSNKATLKMTNGRVIELSGDKKGVVIGEELTYDDGTLLSSTTSGKEEEEISFSVLTTPKGGQYQIELPDGTKVWLNAASTLKYPTQFSEKERVVELEGEAYFEVAQIRRKGKEKENSLKKVPFLVKTSNQEIKVLGTQFNVSAYEDEAETKTTLVEGSVVLTSNGESVKLIPGEQGILSNSRLLKIKIDVMESIAWINNKFIFNETELRVAMKQLSRWYDLKIVYGDNIPLTYFYGEISRNKSLSEVLKILQAGGVNFKIEKLDKGGKLTVLR